jgi:hypothetical protein
VVGVDLGWNDADAVVVLGYNPQITRNVYVVYQWKASKVLISELGGRLAELQRKYKPVSMVCDEGGLGKKVAEEINARYGTCLKPAEKTQKRAYIEIVNADLDAGHLKIVCDDKSGIDETREGLAEEYRDLTWKDGAKQVENPACANHLADATTYGHRECYNYLQPAITLARAAEKSAKGVDTATKVDDSVDDEESYLDPWEASANDQ